jgi:acyl-CoA synthetase (AMP-forming)/AMP-acid ligase II
LPDSSRVLESRYGSCHDGRVPGPPFPHPDATLIDCATGERLAGDALHSRVAGLAAALTALPPGAVFLPAPTSMATVLRYLGARRAGRAVMLLDPGDSPLRLARLTERFRPAVVLTPHAEAPAGYRPADVGAAGRAWLPSGPAQDCHPDLCLLQTTSGSTGEAKLVRLGRAGVRANTDAVISALGITATQVAVTSLPLFYTYGLSVLNTHLAAGATTVIQPGSLLHETFWQHVDHYGVTSLAGVPHQYELLHRMGFDPRDHPSLRVLTQAGGRLPAHRITDFAERMAAVGGRMFILYGQTEAGPRMTTLPAEHIITKLGSVGPAIAGGRLTVLRPDGTETDEPGVTGEVIYRGPNVMLGYAGRAADLARGDDCGGRLRTGDVGHLDADGYLYLAGRNRRVAKVFGVRLSLDDLERLAASHGPAAAVAADDTVRIWLAGVSPAVARQVSRELARSTRLHHTGFDVRPIPALPLLPNGKVDYRALGG